jgi:hypothetical protein
MSGLRYFVSLKVCREAEAIKKETPGRKESHSKDMVIPSVPEASHVIYLA